MLMTCDIKMKDSEQQGKLRPGAETITRMQLATLIVALGLISVALACNCGWMNRGRIVGGIEARKNAYPFIAAILDKNDFRYCGGSIITEWHVLTANHCTNKGRQHKIRVGVNDLTTRDGDTYEIGSVINHELHSTTAFTDDISIIVTKTKIRFNQNVGPVCMPTGRMSLTGQYVKILGWGLLWEKGQSTPRLQEADLKVTSFKQCEEAWKPSPVHPRESTNMCIYEKGKSTCQGDSGGPVIYLNPKTRRFTLAALVSYGSVCGGPIPRVTTDVGAYIPWIQKHIAGSALCSRG